MSWLKLFVLFLLIIGLVVVCLTFDVWAAAFMGLLFAISLIGIAQWICSIWQMPTWLATLLAMLMVGAVLTGLGFIIGPPLVGQVYELRKELPAALDQSVQWLEDRKWGRNAVRRAESLSGVSTEMIGSEGEGESGHDDPGPDPTQAAAQSPSDAALKGNRTSNGSDNGGNTESLKSVVMPIVQSLGTMLTVTATTIMLILVSFVITLYIALNPDVYRRGIMWMVPVQHEALAKLTLSRMCVSLRWWMLGRVASMLAVGLLTSLGMWVIDMPAPLALGAMAGLLSFVPNIGPIVAAVPGLLLAAPEGGWMLLAALSVYVIAQLIESNLITPMVDQYTVTVPPAFLIFIQVVMGVLAGAWGVLIATPLLVVVVVLVQQLYVREYINKPVKVLGSSGDDTPTTTTDP